jgi:hypothetical protein
MTQDKKMRKIKRPPFDFVISKELEETINLLADAVEQGDRIMQSLLEQEIWSYRVEFKPGSDEEDFLLSYYYERGWQHEANN